MNSYVLQDWVTQRFSNTLGPASHPQAASGWLDLAHARDVMLFLELAEVTNPTASPVPMIRYETSPTRDSAQFVEFAAIPLASGTTPLASTTPIVTRVFASDVPPVPLARWIRWKLTRADVGLWDVTFRITVMAYAA